MAEPKAKPGFKVIEGGAAPAAPRSGLPRPERLEEVDDAAIWTLMAQGRLPMQAANDRCAPDLPLDRRGLIPVALGAAVWGLAFVGLWSILA